MLETPHKTLLRKNAEQRFPYREQRQHIARFEEPIVALGG